MKKFLCPVAAPVQSDADSAEACIRATAYGHLMPISGCNYSPDVMALMVAPVAGHAVTGTTGTAMTIYRPEGGQS